MSETLAQTAQLPGQAIDQNTAGGGSPAPSQVAPGSPMRPRLQSIIDQNVSGNVEAAAPHTQAATPTAASAPQPAQQPPQFQAQPAVSPSLRTLFESRGFTVPAGLQNDDAIAELVVQQINAADELQSSDEFRQFVEQRDRFLEWQQKSQESELVKPVDQASSTPAVSVSTIPQDKLLQAITAGFVLQGQDGKFSARHAAFQSHADALNAHAQSVMDQKAALAADPDGFIQKQVQALLANAGTSGGTTSQEVAELRSLLNEIKSERQSQQQAQVNAWVDSNKAKLFDPTNKLTAYGNLYTQFEQAIDAISPNLNPLERHNQVLAKLNAAEAAFRPAQSALTQSQAQSAATPNQPATTQQRQSFLNNAARRDPVNRMSDYSGPASNTIPSQQPRGKGGFTSLRSIIEQSAAVNGTPLN